jgi:peptide/nickel transport system substrate-binding protein
LFIIVLILPLLACNKPAEEKTSGGTLIIGHFYPSPVSLNPLFSPSGISAVFLQSLLFNGLVEIDPNLQLQPALAETWHRSTDGLSWSFTLRQGVRFHDGTELTAKDVKATYDLLRRYPEKTSFPELLGLIRSLSIKDSYTLEIKLSQFSSDFLSCLSQGVLPYQYCNGADAMGKKGIGWFIGTGPFKLIKWQEKEIVLEANPDYFKGRPYLDRVIIRQYPDQQAVWSRLMRGEVDFFYDISPYNYRILEKIPEFQVYSYLHPYYYLLAFNLQNRIFQDIRIRRALNYIIDRQKLIAQVLEGRGQVSAGPIYPLSWAHDPQITPYPYDPSKALHLLQEAGWQDHDGDQFLDKAGQSLTFRLYIVQGDRIMEKTALIIQEQLLNLGIRGKIISIPYDIFGTEYLLSKNFEACLVNLAAREDPNYSYNFYHSSQIREGLNFFSYHNSKVDRLLDQARHEPDQDHRKQLYWLFQQELKADPPGIFLFWREMLTAVHKRFHAVKIGPGGPLLNIHEWYILGPRRNIK